MHKYVIMGVQGCGKGTQAKLLARDFDLVHISVGDIFRWHIQSHTKLQARLHDYHTKTAPVLELFRRKGLVLVVDGTAAPDAVQDEIRRGLGLKQRASRVNLAPVPASPGERGRGNQGAPGAETELSGGAGPCRAAGKVEGRS